MNARDDGPAATQDAGVDWYRDIGEIIDGLGSEALPERLVRGLGRLVPFELAAVFAYRGRSRPLVVYDNFDARGAKQGVAAYVENTYVLNPFYHAHLKGLDDGVYRMRDLAPTPSSKASTTAPTRRDPARPRKSAMSPRTGRRAWRN